MCRLLASADGAIAVNLARDDDWSLLPAWLEADVAPDVAPDWAGVAAAVRTRTMHDCVERGRLLGLAVAPVVPPLSKPLPGFWCCVLPPPLAGEGWGGGARGRTAGGGVGGGPRPPRGGVWGGGGAPARRENAPLPTSPRKRGEE